MQAPERWMNYAEAAAYARVSVPTIKRWVLNRQIPFAKLGDDRNCRVLISENDLGAFIAKHRVKAIN